MHRETIYTGECDMKITPMEKWMVDKIGIKEGNNKELEQYQLNKINEVIAYSKKYSRFYKEHLKCFNELDINSFKDFESIPFTLPHHIKNNPLDFLCVSPKDIDRVVTLRTSGTSSEEKRIYFTEKDLQFTIDFFKHGMSSLVDRKDKVLVLLPGESYGSIGDLLQKALREIDIECYVKGVLVKPKDVAKFIQDKNINCIVGIPIKLLQLSRIESEAFKKNIEKILLSTDYVPKTLVKEITEKFNCKVFAHYGMTEMGYGGGVECEALNGYHMRDIDLYFEIIDPVTGKTVENGQYGEIVFTTLTREGMPLIRYRTGDIAAFSTQYCPCGTFLKTMSPVLGRIDNRIKIDEDKFIYMRDLDEIILSFKAIIDYKAYIEEGNIIFIDLITLNERDFHKVSKEMMSYIKEIPVIKEALVENIIEIVLIHSLEPSIIKNSMTKRRIYDYRKRG